jgi:hypothetical protein
MDKESRFLSALTHEKLQAQERRGKLVFSKLGWATGLFAIGVVKLPLKTESQVILYFVPVIALVYDLYILGENYGIKRMGAFIRMYISNSPEVKWEAWVCGRRDRFSWYALPLSSYIILAICGVQLFNAPDPYGLWNIWLSTLFVLMAIVYLIAGCLVNRLDGQSLIKKCLVDSE